MKWEYIVICYINHGPDSEITEKEKVYSIRGPLDFLIKKLNEFGDKGWEVTSPCLAYSNDKVVILKRPL